jgi:Domain of unknown function (DUF4276)
LTKVYVYVEGPSDKAALKALLAPLLRRLQEKEVYVTFFDETSGDRKKAILLKVPDRAVNILHTQPRSLVVALPDLYPKNKGFAHTTFAELRAGVLENFRAAAQRKKIQKIEELESRFKVFCLKHDLEALLLAAFEPLKAHLRSPALKPTWSLPVEDVNHDHPPKQVVEELFQSCGQRYKDTVDATLVLAASHYAEIARACPQCFQPFVEFLETL